jgi:hypothetical protein
MELALSPWQIAATFREHEADWSQSTARLYRAALVFVFEENGGAEVEDAKAILYHRDSDDEWRMQELERIRQARIARKRRGALRTSAQKVKRFSREDVETLFAELRKSWSQWARPVEVWFAAGMITGLRPVEWMNAEIIATESGQPALFVKNAKHSNGRSHGPGRTLVLDKASEHEMSIIREQLKMIGAAKGIGQFEHHYTECRRLLNRVADRLWPKRLKHPTLYTARHIFSADAKSALGKIEVAALMSHSSTETAGTHYAPRWSGRGSVSVSPSNEDIENVKRLTKAAPTAVTPGVDSVAPAASASESGA